MLLTSVRSPRVDPPNVKSPVRHVLQPGACQNTPQHLPLQVGGERLLRAGPSASAPVTQRRVRLRIVSCRLRPSTRPLSFMSNPRLHHIQVLASRIEDALNRNLSLDGLSSDRKDIPAHMR